MSHSTRSLRFEQQEALLDAEVTAIEKARSAFEKLQAGRFQDLDRAPHACVERIHQLLDKLGLDESTLDSASEKTASEMKEELAKALRFSTEVAPVRHSYAAVLNAHPGSLKDFGYLLMEHIRVASSHDARPRELAREYSRSDARLTKSDAEMKAEMWKNFQSIANDIKLHQAPTENEQVIKSWIDRRVRETQNAFDVESKLKLGVRQANALVEACRRPDNVQRAASGSRSNLDR